MAQSGTPSHAGNVTGLGGPGAGGPDRVVDDRLRHGQLAPSGRGKPLPIVFMTCPNMAMPSLISPGHC